MRDLEVIGDDWIHAGDRRDIIHINERYGRFQR